MTRINAKNGGVKMRMDVNMLLQKIKDNDMSIDDFAEAIGMDRSTFYRKIKTDGIKFTVGQMHKTVEVLDLNKTQAENIFLQQNSQ